MILPSLSTFCEGIESFELEDCDSAFGELVVAGESVRTVCGRAVKPEVLEFDETATAVGVTEAAEVVGGPNCGGESRPSS